MLLEKWTTSKCLENFDNLSNSNYATISMRLQTKQLSIYSSCNFVHFVTDYTIKNCEQVQLVWVLCRCCEAPNDTKSVPSTWENSDGTWSREGEEEGVYCFMLWFQGVETGSRLWCSCNGPLLFNRWHKLVPKSLKVWCVLMVWWLLMVLCLLMGETMFESFCKLDKLFCKYLMYDKPNRFVTRQWYVIS